MMENRKIDISIVIPCRNEERHIEECIISLQKQAFPMDRCEILVVDGQSEDGTLEILSILKKKFVNIRIINNKYTYTPYAFNLGIMEAIGEYILILSAHAKYDNDYILNCFSILNTNNRIDCSGGPITHQGKTKFGQAVALAMSSKIGIGNVSHRQNEYEGYAEMACFPLFRKSIFDQIGLYDEKLINNQDDEFCLRMRLNGKKIYLTNKAKSIYYTRNDVKSLFKQYYNYGYWRVAVLRKHKVNISYRQLVPFIFFSVTFIFAVLGIINKNLFLSAFLPTLYLATILIFTFLLLFKHKINVVIFFPIAVMVLHFSYAAGFFNGLISKNIYK